MRKKQVRLEDIAARAGVSITTVSHVINKTRYVKKETREEVLKILEEMSYDAGKPKRAAVEIRFIGLIVADITEDYSISVIKAIETYASEQGISILLCDSEDDPDKEKANLRTILDRDISGLIISPINSEKCPKELRDADIPVILIDRKYSGHENVYVGINNFQSGFNATKYLIGKGCRDIGFIGYPDTVYTVRQRALGYRACHQEFAPEGVPRVLQLNYKKEDSHKLIREFIGSTRVDGLICATSDICYQVVCSLDELGTRIPEQMKIVTYDDNKWLDYLKYPISVITQPTAEIGIHAIETLISMIEHPGEGKKVASEVFFETGFIDRL
jgi:LacI family transcriptional regulator